MLELMLLTWADSLSESESSALQILCAEICAELAQLDILRRLIPGGWLSGVGAAQEEEQEALAQKFPRDSLRLDSPGGHSVELDWTKGVK